MYLLKQEFIDMGGANISEYDRLEFRARGFIDNATFGRLKDDVPQRKSVRCLMFELIVRLHEVEKQKAIEAEGVKSWSNDGVSVSIKPATHSVSSDNVFEDLIVEYLTGEYDKSKTPLLYRGTSNAKCS